MSSLTETAPAVQTPPLEVPQRLPLRSDGTRLMTLSASSLRLFWKCPERWRRRYLLRERESQGGAMVVGKSVGAAITAHFAAQIAGQKLSLSEADDLVVAEFEESAAQPLTDFGSDEPAGLREQGREALRAYLAELAPQVRPRAVERRFELRFEEAEWSLTGYLDVEDERDEVIDTKVKAKHVSKADALGDPQATMYLLARRLEGRESSRFSFHSIRRGVVKSGSRCLVVPALREVAALGAFEARVAATARQIDACAESGEWPLSSPDGWWCSSGMCRFWADCPGGAGAPELLAA
jgi:hypothetical protein